VIFSEVPLFVFSRKKNPSSGRLLLWPVVAAAARRRCPGSGKRHGRLGLEMVMGTRNPMGFYLIRVWVWVNFHTHGFVNGHKCILDGFMDTGLFL
jgi:hypothetical protein